MKRHKFSERSPEYYLADEVDSLIAAKDEEIADIKSKVLPMAERILELESRTGQSAEAFSVVNKQLFVSLGKLIAGNEKLKQEQLLGDKHFHNAMKSEELLAICNEKLVTAEHVAHCLATDVCTLENKLVAAEARIDELYKAVVIAWAAMADMAPCMYKECQQVQNKEHQFAKDYCRPFISQRDNLTALAEHDKEVRVKCLEDAADHFGANTLYLGTYKTSMGVERELRRMAQEIREGK